MPDRCPGATRIALWLRWWRHGPERHDGRHVDVVRRHPRPERHAESRSLTALAIDVYRKAVLVGDALHHGEAYPRAVRARREECVEEALLGFRIDSDSVVLDGEKGDAAHVFDANAHEPPGRGRLNRVAHEVPDELAQLRGVRSYAQRILSREDDAHVRHRPPRARRERDHLAGEP